MNEEKSELTFNIGIDENSAINRAFRNGYRHGFEDALIKLVVRKEIPHNHVLFEECKMEKELK